MTVNILLAVGGTGAKVAEAIVHAAAAGLGPDELRVGFIDQDDSNGNTTRARALVSDYADARRQWRTSAGAHRIDGGTLLAPDIDFVHASQLWTPHPDANATLARIFGTMPDDKPLFDLLFRPGADEQDMELRGGYRGKPFIGSAAITTALQVDGDPFWRAIAQLWQRAGAAQQVRVLLAGSVFGGTGAAGFPTIARLLKRRIDAAGMGGNVRVGGVLMLPYFGFDPPPFGATGRAANVARSDELLMQSRGALRYYEAFAREKVFDALYVIGWNRPFELGYYAADTAEQENPALPPELIAALGGCKFFRDPADALTGADRAQACARGDAGELDWSDLPSPDGSLADAPYRHLGQALRFAVAWKHYRALIARPRGSMKKLTDRSSFYNRQKVDAVDYRAHAPDAPLEAMDAYVDQLIGWAFAIEDRARRQGLSFELWRLEGAVLPPRTDVANAPVQVRPGIDEAAMAETYARAVTPPPATAALPTSAALLHALTASVAPGEHQGLGRMLASLHAFSAV